MKKNKIHYLTVIGLLLISQTNNSFAEGELIVPDYDNDTNVDTGTNLNPT